MVYGPIYLCWNFLEGWLWSFKCSVDNQTLFPSAKVIDLFDLFEASCCIYTSVFFSSSEIKSCISRIRCNIFAFVGQAEIRSGGDNGLKPYNASKGENFVEECTELL